MQKAQNLLVSSLILGTLLAPSLTMAQISAPATTEQVDTLKSTLITLLTQLIAQLQEQINTILAAQAKTDTNVAAVAAKVDTVVQNTTPPALISVASASVPVTSPEIKIQFGIGGGNFVDAPIATSRPFILIGVNLIGIEGCPSVRLTTDNPSGFYSPNGVSRDYTFFQEGCALSGSNARQMDTKTPGTYHLTAEVVGMSVSTSTTFTVNQ